MVRRPILWLSLVSLLVGFSMGCLATAIALSDTPPPFGSSDLLQLNFSDGSYLLCGAAAIEIKSNAAAPGLLTVVTEGTQCPSDDIFRNGFE
jgi:hypothetical protein